MKNNKKMLYSSLFHHITRREFLFCAALCTASTVLSSCKKSGKVSTEKEHGHDFSVGQGYQCEPVIREVKGMGDIVVNHSGNALFFLRRRMTGDSFTRGQNLYMLDLTKEGASPELLYEEPGYFWNGSIAIDYQDVLYVWQWGVGENLVILDLKKGIPCKPILNKTFRSGDPREYQVAVNPVAKPQSAYKLYMLDTDNGTIDRFNSQNGVIEEWMNLNGTFDGTDFSGGGFCFQEVGNIVVSGMERNNSKDASLSAIFSDKSTNHVVLDSRDFPEAYNRMYIKRVKNAPAEGQHSLYLLSTYYSGGLSSNFILWTWDVASGKGRNILDASTWLIQAQPGHLTPHDLEVDSKGNVYFSIYPFGFNIPKLTSVYKVCKK